VKFVTVGFKNESDVLRRIGLVVGQPFDLQKVSLVSSSQLSMLTLAAAMIDPSYAKLKKPHHEFHHAWESKTLDEDHILYAAMDAYLCLNIYKGWMKKQSPQYLGGHVMALIPTTAISTPFRRSPPLATKF